MKKLIFLVLVGSLFCGLYVFRIAVIETIAPRIASKIGVEIKDLQFERIDFNRIVIKHLVISQSDAFTDSELRLRELTVLIDISLPDLSRINFSLQEFVRLRGVTLEFVNTDVNLLQADHRAENNTNIKDYLKFIPLYDINIKHINVSYMQLDELIAEFEGSLSQQSGYSNELGLTGSLQYGEVITDIHFNLMEDVLKVSVVNAETAHDILRLDGKYFIDNDWLQVDAEGEYSLDYFSTYFDDWLPQLTIQKASGDLGISMQLDLAQDDEDIVANMLMDLNVGAVVKFSSQQYSIRDAQIDMRAECSMQALEVKTCQVNQPQRLALQFDVAPRLMSNYLEGDVTNYQLELNPNDAIKLTRQSDESNGYTVKGGAKLFIADNHSRVKTKVELSEIEFHWIDNQWSLLSDYQLALDANDIMNVFAMQRALLSADGSIDADKDKIRFHVNDNAHMVLFDAEYQGVIANRLEMRQQGVSKSEYIFGSNQFYLENYVGDMELKDVEYADLQFEIDPLRVEVEEYRYIDNKHYLDAQTSLQKLKVKRKGLNIVAAEIIANAYLKEDLLGLDGGMLLGSKRAPLEFSLRDNLSIQSGNLKFESQPIALTENEVMAQLIGMSGFPLQLVDGSFTLDGHVDWQNGYQNAKTRVNVSAIQIDGDYAQNVFNDLNVDMSLHRSSGNGWVLDKPTTLTIGRMNVGVLLSDISMRIEEYEYGVREQPAVKVVEFYTDALDGSIYSDVIDIDLNESENSFSLYVSSLSLEKLVELNQTEDLIATGVINGELPMKLTGGVLEIDKGWLRADENGGIIRYHSVTGVLSGNEKIKLVAELLKNFQYTEMSALLNLYPDGAIRLETKLHGHSPEAQFDAPINLNFNIDFNLWEFLESARLLTRISQDVADKVGSQ